MFKNITLLALLASATAAPLALVTEHEEAQLGGCEVDDLCAYMWMAGGHTWWTVGQAL